MMKKRNVAVAMAAMTMATTAAPLVAQAAEVVDKEIMKSEQAKLINKVRELLDVTYDDEDENGYGDDKVPTLRKDQKKEALNSVYEIRVKGSDSIITSINELKAAINTDKDVTIVITDKGHTKDSEGKIIATSSAKYTVKDLIKLSDDRLSNDELNAERRKYDNLKASSQKLLDRFEKDSEYSKFKESVKSEIEELSNLLKVEVPQTANLEELIQANEGLSASKKKLEDKVKLLQEEVESLESTKKAYEELKEESSELLSKFESGGEYSQFKNQAEVEINELKRVMEKDLTFGGTKEPSKQDIILAKAELASTKWNLENKIKDLQNGITYNIREVENENTDSLIGVEGIDSVSYDNVKNILTIRLKNSDEIELSEGKDKLDFNSPKRDNKGNVIGFNKAKAVDIEKEVLANVTLTDRKLQTVDSSKLFDGVMLTEDGKAIVKANGSTVTIDDINYKVTVDSEDGVQTVEKDKEYKLVLEFTLRAITKGNQDIVHKLTINSDNKLELENLLNMAIDNKNAQTATEISGKNRVETAISVSKELYVNPEHEGNSADAIVLVEENSIVDGLTATPLAVASNAPILYTNSSSVQSSVKAEIKRVLNYENKSISDLKDTTVYLVGGETKLSANIVEEMKALGLKVKRVSGDNRAETSLEVAKEINKIANENKDVTVSEEAFIVGYDGEADAMSIASRAGNKKSIMPIIVSDREKLSKDAIELASEKFKSFDIIGGSTVVAETIEDQLTEEFTSSKVERVEGENRFKTNAAVIEKYYKDAKTVYVAKDGQAKKDELVDSLVGGRLAANEAAPVVLATNNLSDEQSDAIELVAGKASLVQVGGGVTKTVIEKIAKVLGL